MKNLMLILSLMVNNIVAQPQVTWLKQFGSYKANTGSGNIVELSDSSYTLLANYDGTVKIIHLNYLGDTVWTKTYPTYFINYSFIKTNDGGYAMLGGINNWVLIKTDSMGDTLWTKPYPQLSDPLCLIQTSDGGYAIGSYNGWDMIKTDSTGILEWTASAFNGIHVQGLIECFNKEFLVYGNSGFNPFCYKAALFDSLGNLKWVNAYGNVTYLGADLESIVSAVQLPDSNFIMGCSIDTTIQGHYHLIKVKYSDGTLLDSIIYNDLQSYDLCRLKVVNNSNIILYSNNYLKKIDTTFNTLWVKVFIFYISSASQTLDKGYVLSGTSPFMFTNLNGINYAKLDSLGNIYNFQSIPELAVNELRVYPNPAVNQLAASPPTPLQGRGEVTVTIYDIFGKVHLQQTQMVQNDFKVDINNLPSGIYMLQLKQEDRLFNGRFVKE